MLVTVGRKHWTIYPRRVAHLLRPSYAHGHDAVFEEEGEEAPTVDDAGGAAAGMRLSLERWECVLQPGELLFVPSGCPHQVTNLTPTCAISANFVHESNLRLAIDELEVAGLTSKPAADLAAQLARHEAARPLNTSGRNSASCSDTAAGDEDVDLEWRAFKRGRGAGI